MSLPNGNEPAVSGAVADRSSLRKLFSIKSLDLIMQDAAKPEFQLRRVLGPFHLVLLGIGAIVGAGIFATIGTAAAGDAARPGAGPALMVSFIITAFVCAFTALCYAEFASMVPISGSAYTYSYATLGEVIAWIIGWDLIIEYAVGNIGVAISWANYFKTFVEGLHFRVPDWLLPAGYQGIFTAGIHVPAWVSMDYRSAAKVVDANGVQTVFRDAPHVLGVPVVFNFLAVLIVAVITLVLIWGIRESARFNAVMVSIKILVLAFFIIVGCFWIKPSNWVPFAPNGWAGISAGAAIVFFAYIGFDAVSTVAEETRNPKRNLPIGIIGSLIICTVLYIVVSAVFTGLISYPKLIATLTTEKAEPLTLALQKVGAQLGWAVGIVAFGSVIAHTAVLLVFQLGQPRIFFSMARDGLLPKIFQRVHPRYRTPWVSTLLTGVFVASVAAIANIEEMVDLTNIGTLFAFILVCAGIMVMRFKYPERDRPFRVPSGWKWSAPMFGIYVIGVILMPFTPLEKWIAISLAVPVFIFFRNHIFPMLGIISCFYLIYYLPATSWLRFAAWLNFGFVIYAGYGSINSRLSGRKQTSSPAEHDAYTARISAALAVLGVAMLLLMHVFNEWLSAFQARSHAAMNELFIRLVTLANPIHGFIKSDFGLRELGLSKLDRAGAAFHQVLLLKSWLAPSFFLHIPLALNAFVLCPIVLWRFYRAGRDGAPRSRGTWLSLAVSLVLLLSISVYLYCVLAGGGK